MSEGQYRDGDHGQSNVFGLMGSWEPSFTAHEKPTATAAEPNTSSTKKVDSFDDTAFPEYGTLFDDPQTLRTILRLDQSSCSEAGTRLSDLVIPSASIQTTPYSKSLAIATPDQKSCRICGLQFDSLTLLEQHSRRAFHRIHCCNYPGCGKSYYRRDVYIRHKAKHRDGESHICRLCECLGQEKAFKRKDHLNQHVRNCHWSKESGTWVPGAQGRSQMNQGSLEPPPGTGSVLVVDQISVVSDQGSGRRTSSISDLAPQGKSFLYESSAIQELAAALESIVDPQELLLLKGRLPLDRFSTIEQLAWKLRELIFQSPSGP